jgi:Mn2+/Fe2+ NRAMP family transporter
MQAAPVTLSGRLRYLGPGVVVAGSVIGSGELILTTSLGAAVGFALLWFLLIACWSKSIVQAELARLCILNRSTFLELFNTLPGKLPGRRKRVSWLVWYFFFSSLVVMFTAGGILGAATEGVLLLFPGSPRLGVAIGLTVLASVVMGSGSYRLLEKLFLVMVLSFTVISVACAAALYFSDLAVPISEVLSRQSFTFPVEYAPLIVAVFSYTGLNVGESIYYSYFCLDKGYANHIGDSKSAEGIDRARGWMKVVNTDVWLTLFLLTAVTVPFYYLGAGVLHISGSVPGNDDMISIIGSVYVQVMGPWIEPVFLLGAILVLYSTLLAWVGGDSRQVTDNLVELGLLPNSPAVRKRWTRLIGYSWPFCFLALFWFFKSPLTLIVIGGISYALTGPLVVLGLLYLRRSKLPPELRSGNMATALLYLALCVMLVVGIGTIYFLF